MESELANTMELGFKGLERAVEIKLCSKLDNTGLQGYGN